MKKNTGYQCPCCEYLTRSKPEHGTFEICPVCFWEDDEVQFKDPAYEGGANEMSLDKARENYKEFGAISEKFKSFVRRPQPAEIPLKLIKR